MVDSIRMLFFCYLSFSSLRISFSQDILSVTQSIKDGDNETLVSAGGIFELGFFSPANSTTASRYLGIWYKNVTPLTVVWVANRGTPLQNISGVLELNEKGVLLLLNATNSTVWSSYISSKAVINNPIAQLLDSGNLVVKNKQDSNNEDNFLWQSFDYPSDTLLPGMKLGWNLVTGLDRFLTSWKSEDDPSMGDYTVKLDIRGYPQLFGYVGSVIMGRAGSWNGLTFTGYPAPEMRQAYSLEFVMNEKEIYYTFKVVDTSVFSVYTLLSSGKGVALVWTNQSNSRGVVSTGGEDQCENYALCGPYAICNLDGNTPSCQCLKGFVPKFPQQWNISYWKNGCVRRTKLGCDNKDGFLRYTSIKLPDTSSSWFNETMNLEECQNTCLKNCSCKSYANLDIRNGGSGCLLWFGDLIDMRKFNQGQDIYIRVPNSELDNVAVNGHGNKKKMIVGITAGVTIFALTTCVCIVIIKKPGVARKLYSYRKHYKNKLRKEEIDLPTFDLSIIAKATENFSSSNKLGEGGFGSVYKGMLTDGQEIAVKRLSKKSRQGLEELKNEVVLIAKLQHRNLVKLIGCCIQAEEKMLIYEYMSNKSLDYFIFDKTRRRLLDWLKCFDIIRGIARGLLYLHQDSRLRIIHRDLKTSNILLDENLDPKISDFGMARIFLGDQDEANTNKVAGTYGYMPPEYAVHGHFSVKSDVFSYGVIVLEIVSGKKNREFSDPDHHLNLLAHAWTLWTAERPLELLDEMLGERCNPAEVIRCIQVGLLCVQQRPEDRPDMSSVVLMLNGEKLLAKPKVPGFYSDRDTTTDADSSSSNRKLFSANEISMTLLEAR